MLTKAQIKKLSLEELQNLALTLSQKNFMLERALWGRKSEKLSRIDIEQGLLFNEIEVEAKSQEQEQAALEKEAPLFVQAHTRKKPGRRPLPKELPRIEIIHDITNKTCSHGHTLERIGEDESEKLRVIPMQIEVERHIYPKYVSVTCSKESQESKAVIAPNSESEVITAPREPSLIPRSFTTPSLLSYMWAYRAETDSGTVILFEYWPSRSGKFLPKRLHNFRGTVMCDGFSGYNSLDEMKDIQVVNCWVHVRQKFLNHGETKWLY